MASKPSGIRPPTALKTPAAQGASSVPRPSGLPVMRRGASSLSQADPDSSSVGAASDVSGVPSTDHFIIGDTIWVGGLKRGKIAFIGETHFAKGEWAGVVLDEPLGKNDGFVSGYRYFQCEALHGTFTRLVRLSHKPLDPSGLPDNDTSMSSMATPSKPAEKLRSPSPTPSQGSPGFGTPTRLGSPAPLKLGDRVIVQSTTGTKRGVLRFMGGTDFAAGDWAGIELDQAVGKNDGAVGGRRYFQCRDKYGLFAPISKVSSSPMNRRPSSSNLRRQSSRESLISNISSASSVAPSSSRRASTHMRTQCLPSCSLQSVLKENERHAEQLMKERDLDRNELALLTKQYDECLQELKAARNDCMMLQQSRAEQIATNEKDNEVTNSLKLQLEEEYRKYEDLLFGLEEERIAKSDLQSQLDSFTDLGAHKLQLENEIVELKKQLEDTTQTLCEKSTIVEKIATEFNEANKSIEVLKGELANGMTNVNETIENYETKLKEASELYQKEQESMEKRLIDLENLVSSKEQIIKDIRDENENFRVSMQETSSKLAKATTECDRLREHKSRLEDEVMNLVTSGSSSAGELTAKLMEKDTIISQLTEKVEILETEFESKMKTSLGKYSEDRETWTTREVGLKEEIEKLTDVVNKCNEELKIERSTMNSLRESLASKQQEVDTLNQSFLAEKGKIETEYLSKLGTVQETAEGSVAQLKEKVQLMQQSLNAKIEALTSEKSELEKNNESLKQEIVSINGQLSVEQEKSKTLVSKMQSDLTNVVTERAELDLQLLNLTKDFGVMSDKIQEYENCKTENQQKIQELLKEIDLVRSDMTDHENQKIKLQKSLAGLAQASEADKEASKIAITEKDRENSMLKDSLSKFELEITYLKEESATIKKELKQKDAALMARENEKNEPQSKNEEANAVPDTEAHINFLNSIVVDLQNKNDDLQKKLDIVLAGGRLSDANYNTVSGAPSKSAPRLYCDICEQFDLHETEDCPTQESEPDPTNSHHNLPRGGTRPYCETCEVFGHWTKDCDDGETF